MRLEKIRWEESSDQLGFVGHVEIRFIFLLFSPLCLLNNRKTHGTFGAQKRHDLILIFRRCLWCCVGNELLQYSCLEKPMACVISHRISAWWAMWSVQDQLCDQCMHSLVIPHATWQLSQWATTCEPELWSLQVATIKPTLHDYWSLCTFEPVPWNKRSPCNGEALKPQLEKDCAQQQRPSATKKKKKISKLKNALYSHADVCIDIIHTSICMP